VARDIKKVIDDTAEETQEDTKRVVEETAKDTQDELDSDTKDILQKMDGVLKEVRLAVFRTPGARQIPFVQAVAISNTFREKEDWAKDAIDRSLARLVTDPDQARIMLKKLGVEGQEDKKIEELTPILEKKLSELLGQVMGQVMIAISSKNEEAIQGATGVIHDITENAINMKNFQRLGSYYGEVPSVAAHFLTGARAVGKLSSGFVIAHNIEKLMDVNENFITEFAKWPELIDFVNEELKIKKKQPPIDLADFSRLKMAHENEAFVEDYIKKQFEAGTNFAPEFTSSDWFWKAYIKAFGKIKPGIILPRRLFRERGPVADKLFPEGTKETTPSDVTTAINDYLVNQRIQGGTGPVSQFGTLAGKDLPLIAGPKMWQALLEGGGIYSGLISGKEDRREQDISAVKNIIKKFIFDYTRSIPIRNEKGEITGKSPPELTVEVAKAALDAIAPPLLDAYLLNKQKIEHPEMAWPTYPGQNLSDFEKYIPAFIGFEIKKKDTQEALADAKAKLENQKGGVIGIISSVMPTTSEGMENRVLLRPQQLSPEKINMAIQQLQEMVPGAANFLEELSEKRLPLQDMAKELGDYLLESEFGKSLIQFIQEARGATPSSAETTNVNKGTQVKGKEDHRDDAAV